MPQKNTLSKAIALTAICGPMVLLFLGAAYDILSPREWAFGTLAWFAAILLFAIVRKLTARETPGSTVVPMIAIDDGARRRILRGILINKISIGILALLLPFSIANGVAHRAWLPTLAGVGMDLLFMYVLAQQIRLRRMLLDAPRE